MRRACAWREQIERGATQHRPDAWLTSVYHDVDPEQEVSQYISSRVEEVEGVHNFLAVACQPKPPHQEAQAGLPHPTEQPAGAAQFAASEASATEA